MTDRVIPLLKGTGVLVKARLVINQQCTCFKEGENAVDYLKTSVACRLSKVVIPLYSDEATSKILRPLWGPFSSSRGM